MYLEVSGLMILITVVMTILVRPGLRERARMSLLKRALRSTLRDERYGSCRRLSAISETRDAHDPRGAKGLIA